MNMYQQRKCSMSKTFLVSEFLDAMEKNGYEKYTSGWYFGHVEGKFKACAFGQAAINLGVHADDLNARFNLVLSEGKSTAPLLNSETATRYPTASRIIHINDDTDISVSDIARQVRAELPEEILNAELTVSEYDWSEEIANV